MRGLLDIVINCRKVVSLIGVVVLVMLPKKVIDLCIIVINPPLVGVNCM